MTLWIEARCGPNRGYSLELDPDDKYPRREAL